MLYGSSTQVDRGVAAKQDCQIGVTVTAKDGEEAVKCAAEKVKGMFEATCDLRD